MSISGDPHLPIIAPAPSDARLTRDVFGFDYDGIEQRFSVVQGRPLTMNANKQEIATVMKIIHVRCTVGLVPTQTGPRK